MFYVKVDHPSHDHDPKTFDPLEESAELIAADAGNLRWNRLFVPFDSGNVKDSDDNPHAPIDVDVFNEVAKRLDIDYAVAHVGSLIPQHDNGRTVNWVHWFDSNLVGHLVVTTADVYILGDNGKTIDRV